MKLLSILLLINTSFAATELAKVNNSVITLEDFNKKYSESLKFFRFKAPTKSNVLEEIIGRDLGIQEAKKLGLDKDPEVQDKMNTVLYHALLDKKLSSKFDAIQVSDDEVESYYKKYPEVRTSHIFVQLRFDATQAQTRAALEKIKRIQSILNEATKSGKKTFAEVAREYSEGVAAVAGGDIDYQTKDKLDPSYYEAALNLKKVGNVSEIVKSQFGYHIIKLTGIRDFSEVDRGQYKRIIYDEKRTKIFDAYVAELKQKAKITVKQDLLKD